MPSHCGPCSFAFEANISYESKPTVSAKTQTPTTGVLRKAMPSIVFDASPTANDVDHLTARLLESNQEKLAGYAYQSFMFRADDETGQMNAGVHGIVGGGWLYIDSLWVKEGLRGEGLGKKLLTLAEAEAKKRGCIGSYLYTYSFQNPGFYKKLGYAEFGILERFAEGHTKIYMTKPLVPHTS